MAQLYKYNQLYTLYRQRPPELNFQTLGQWFAVCFKLPSNSILWELQGTVSALAEIKKNYPIEGERELAILNSYNRNHATW